MLRADRFYKRFEKGDHVVLRYLFDLGDAPTSIVAFFAMRAAVPRGTCPACSNAPQAASSTASQISYFRFNSQMAFILGRV